MKTVIAAVALAALSTVAIAKKPASSSPWILMAPPPEGPMEIYCMTAPRDPVACETLENTDIKAALQKVLTREKVPTKGLNLDALLQPDGRVWFGGHQWKTKDGTTRQVVCSTSLKSCEREAKARNDEAAARLARIEQCKGKPRDPKAFVDLCAGYR